MVSSEHSKEIASLVGPTMVAMTASEFPMVQPHLYDSQTPPVVYLSGVLIFVAGLAIVRTHNRWGLIGLSWSRSRAGSQLAWVYSECLRPGTINAPHLEIHRAPCCTRVL